MHPQFKNPNDWSKSIPGGNMDILSISVGHALPSSNIGVGCCSLADSNSAWWAVTTNRGRKIHTDFSRSASDFWRAGGRVVDAYIERIEVKPSSKWNFQTARDFLVVPKLCTLSSDPERFQSDSEIFLPRRDLCSCCRSTDHDENVVECREIE